MIFHPAATEEPKIDEDDIKSTLISISDCECCGEPTGVKSHSSRTAFPYDGPVGSPDNPNRNVMLCDPCAEEHHANWDSTWSEYHAGLL